METARVNRLWLLLTLLAVFMGIVPSAYAQKPDILEVVELQGEINGSTAERIAAKVEEINENGKVRAVLLVLDTPGGSVTASSAIYEDLARLKVPVVVWCQSMCASGGVYLAMSPAVKFIGVRDQTIGGSVGVVMQMMRYNRLLEWAKVDPKTYRSGVLKDSGNPTRPMEDAEDKYLQGIVSNLADRFYEIVGKARKVTAWEEVKTARIFIGRDIVRVGLADAVLSRKQAETKAKELSGSKTIFTREELKKMSSAAESHASYAAEPARPSMLDGLMSDAHYLADMVREVHAGESVTFAYRLPLKF